MLWRSWTKACIILLWWSRNCLCFNTANLYVYNYRVPSSSSNPKDYKCKKGQERREYFYSGECSFVVHLNENLRNESFSWSFERKNLCRPCYEGQRLVEVCLSLVAGKVRLSVTLLWLKFLVLNSFPCFAGFFDHPPLNTKEHDRLKHETKDKRQISILERKKNWIDPQFRE